jgi:hypothetical protein
MPEPARSDQQVQTADRDRDTGNEPEQGISTEVKAQEHSSARRPEQEDRKQHVIKGHWFSAGGIAAC